MKDVGYDDDDNDSDNDNDDDSDSDNDNDNDVDIELACALMYLLGEFERTQCTTPGTLPPGHPRPRGPVGSCGVGTPTLA
jgi:hypothetical protein